MSTVENDVLADHEVSEKDIETLEKWNKYYLYAGLLDDITILKKAINIFYENSHFPFMDIEDKKLKV